MQSRGVVDGVLGKLGGTGSLVGRGARMLRGGAVSAAKASWRAVKGLVPERASPSEEQPSPVSTVSLPAILSFCDCTSIQCTVMRYPAAFNWCLWGLVCKLERFNSVQEEIEHGSAAEPEASDSGSEAAALPPLDLTTERAAVSTATSSFSAAEKVGPSSMPPAPASAHSWKWATA